MVKPHEAPGGVFATGIIVRKYRQGQTISVKIQITAKHKGFYEFKLCPNNNVLQDPTQACFDRLKLTSFSYKTENSEQILIAYLFQVSAIFHQCRRHHQQKDFCRIRASRHVFRRINTTAQNHVQSMHHPSRFKT